MNAGVKCTVQFRDIDAALAVVLCCDGAIDAMHANPETTADSYT
jgi:hypothetical protein